MIDYLDLPRPTAQRRRVRLPSLPWVEFLGFLILIALTLPSG